MMKDARALLSLDDALALLVAGATRHRILQVETLASFDAPGRVLAADLKSLLDVPPADNTSMDGYALRAADVPAAGTLLPVSQRIPAGHVGGPLQPGTAARIFTGGQVPPGADAVVMQEQCEAVASTPGDGQGTVRVNAVPQAGQWIRLRGEDVQRGATVLAAGARLTPQALGLAATVGAATLDVPPEDNTSMDGYALRVADVPSAGGLLPVSQRIPAGVVGHALQPGTAARIFTGGQVPAGADAVVMQEQCEAVPGDGFGTVRVNTVPAHGQWEIGRAHV